jgi:hypothetical protein
MSDRNRPRPRIYNPPVDDGPGPRLGPPLTKAHELLNEVFGDLCAAFAACDRLRCREGGGRPSNGLPVEAFEELERLAERFAAFAGPLRLKWFGPWPPA